MTKNTDVTNPTKSTLTDELTKAGFSPREVERYFAQVEYRKNYASRPDVVEARKAYNKVRSDRMKALRAALKNLGE